MIRLLLISLFVCLFGGFAAAQSAPNLAKPLTIGLTDELYSKTLGEKRVLNIYLPDGYKQDSATKYPVIYLLDGGMDEDFLHVAGIVQFDTFPWIAQIPPSIVVGIVNVDRRRDLTFPTTVDAERKRYPTTGHSDKFIEFIKNELQPFVESKYHGGGSRMLIGESLGGLFAAEVLIKEPALFDKYVIVSPSIWWDNGSILEAQVGALKKLTTETTVYIAVGNEGLTPAEKPRVQAVDANLLAEKLRTVGNARLKVSFDYLPGESHATIGHQAVFNAFRALYPAAKRDN